MRSLIGCHWHLAVSIVTIASLGEASPCVEQLIDHVSGPRLTRQEYQSSASR